MFRDEIAHPRRWINVSYFGFCYTKCPYCGDETAWYNPMSDRLQSDLKNNQREYCPTCGKRVYAREGWSMNQPPIEEFREAMNRREKMSRTIDAECVTKRLQAKKPSNDYMKVMLDECIAEIKSAPTIEPERKKGKWIPVDSFSAFGGDEATWMTHGNPIAFYYCSECKEQTYAGEDGEPLLTDYCPDCGADMRGKE